MMKAGIMVMTLVTRTAQQIIIKKPMTKAMNMAMMTVLTL
nr:MAG TPA: hypothetical protein [Caudoviricetes sp.]